MARAARETSPACAPARGCGESLGSVARSGDALLLLEGYYGCNRVQRGDLVALRWAGRAAPLAKVAHGLPGDVLSLHLGPGGWELRVNGAPARTSQGEPYFIDERSRRVLAQYAQREGGRIPEGGYLLLGDRATLTTDARAFGLVAREDLLGLLLPLR